ncbi:MAG: C25 family cysteine peptidase, partial [Thermoplasmatota archaeon]
LYPESRYIDYNIGYSRGYAIASINLNPMQYNPKEGIVQYYPELTLSVSLQEDGPNQLFRDRADDKAWVQKLVLNPEIADLYGFETSSILEYPGGICDPADHYDYVIITTTQNGLDHWDTTSTTPYNWQSLLDHHNGNGLSGTLVTREDIIACPDYWNTTALFNDTQAKIREFCKDAYQSWGTSYVLIGGNGALVPARKMKTAYEGNIDSDIYYSNLDKSFNANQNQWWGEEGDEGFDLYAELFIGRVTCNSPQDVSNWLTKNFYYADSVETDYLDNAAFYGGSTGWTCQGDDFIDYSAIKGTDDWLGPNPGYSGPFPTWVGFQYGFETWNTVNPNNAFDLSVKWTAEPPNPGWQGGSTSSATTGLRNAINNDQATLISGIAHANPQMSLDVYQSSWQTLYHNTKPFFVHDYGCHCGDFSSNPTGVLHTMLFMSDTKLAFACVYNTCYGWGNFYSTNSSSAFQQKEFWSYFFDVDNKSTSLSEWQLGKGHAFSKDRMAPTINWNPSYGTWRAIIQGCLLFGDPAQTIKTPNPSTPPNQPDKPSGPTLGVLDEEYFYTTKTTDPDNDQIYYLFDWDDGSNSGWLGPYSSGQQITASYIWNDLGEYHVRVRARDVWGSGSIWSETLVVTITDNTPPSIPEITGPSSGKPGVTYLYNIVSTDAQNHNIYYYVDWGDETTSDWIGPYVSGNMIHLTHSWEEKGTYEIKVKAKDSLDAESEWGYLEFVAPVNLFSSHTLYQRFLHFLLSHYQGLN